MLAVMCWMLVGVSPCDVLRLCVRALASRTESWQPITADVGYTARMKKLWLQSWRQTSDVSDLLSYLTSTAVSTSASQSGPPVLSTLAGSSYTPVPAEAAVGQGPTGNSTGLGLPLSRALAKVGGGWLSLTDTTDVDLTSRDKQSRAVSTTRSGHALSATGRKSFTSALARVGGSATVAPRDYAVVNVAPPVAMTWYWCVVEAPAPSLSDRPATHVTSGASLRELEWRQSMPEKQIELEV